jgi:hypothetical protein
MVPESRRYTSKTIREFWCFTAVESATVFVFNGSFVTAPPSLARLGALPPGGDIFSW